MLGENRLQQIFKDYNGQTYWVTFNYNELWNKKIKLFDYIDFAVGYSIDGFTGGHNNPEISSCNCVTSDCNNLKRTSQFIFSLDWNTSKIKNNHPILGKFLLPFDIIKAVSLVRERGDTGNSLYIIIISYLTGKKSGQYFSSGKKVANFFNIQSLQRANAHF